MSEVRFGILSREDITELARSGCPVVVPLAATEQHGPHLPASTDSVICEHVALEAAAIAAKTVQILVAPTITIGCSQHHLAFGGTLSYRSATYLRMLQDIGDSLFICGFRKIIFLNGHGGNEAIMNQAASDLAVKYPVWTASGSYWTIARDALREVHAHEVGMVAGHAGGFETALMMALRPEWVQHDRIVEQHSEVPWIAGAIPGTFVGRHGQLTGFDGYTGAPYSATADRGAQYLKTIVQAVAEWLIAVSMTMAEGELDERKKS